AVACEAHVRQVAATAAHACSPAARPGHDALILDMEDAGTTEFTLGLHERLRSEGLPVAVTVQAYLHRIRDDLDRLVSAGAWIRRVKGAFAEPGTIAARCRAAISRRYLEGVMTLLSRRSRDSGCYPSFATQDDRIIELITDTARSQGWRNEDFEFEMLHGV